MITIKIHLKHLNAPLELLAEQSTINTIKEKIKSGATVIHLSQWDGHSDLLINLNNLIMVEEIYE